MANFNGHPKNVTGAIREVIEEANDLGLYVTSTTDGVHSPTSYHSSGRAVDVAAPMTTAGIKLMKKFQRRANKKWPGAREIFGPDNTAFIKNGQKYTIREGDPLEDQHDNHVHVAR